MFHTKSEHLERLLLLLDLAVSALIFLVILDGHRVLYPDVPLDYAGHGGVLLVLLSVFGPTRYVLTSKTPLQPDSMLVFSRRLLLAMAVTAGITASQIFLLKLQFVSQMVVGIFFAVNTVALLLIRYFLVWWYFSIHKETREDYLRVLIIGSGARAHVLADRLKHAFAWGVNIVGFLDPKGESAGRRSNDEILGHVDQISEILRANVIEEVIVAVPRSLLGDVQEIIDACQEEGVKLRFMANFYDFNAARVGLTMVENIPLISFEPVARGEVSLTVKRMIDLFLTLLAIPLLLPVFALVALAIRIDSRGPAFFTQDRVGLHKRRFKLYKFRSMVVDAEARMQEVEHLNEAEGPNFKVENDPRVTRLGRFLRKTSIDELPQLFNVLRGDMSLVGPRPMSLRDVDLFDKGVQRKRFSVRPGITCLWQISGRSNLTFDEWLELDLKYIENWSLGMDLRILVMTIPTVLKGSGAV